MPVRADPQAITISGPVRGTRVEGATRPIASYLGIPFAAPPIGELRFAPPSPPARWSTERDARAFGCSPPQVGGALLDLLGSAPRGEQSEDCLSINVWTPGADDALRPVMVWIHGGAFISGSSDAAVYDGTRLAARGDVVVVSFNYRVGALGYLYLDSHLAPHLAPDRAGPEAPGGPARANFGLLDQIAALEWVRDNIAAFGGDPGRVTLFGESAGAGSIGALLAAPRARGLFHRAIAQSGAPDGYITTDEARARTARLLEVLGNSADTLRAVPVAALLAAQQKCAAERVWSTGMFFTPVIDGEILPERPMQAVRAGTAARVPLILGTTRDELQLYKFGAPSPELGDEVVAGVIGQEVPGAVSDGRSRATEVLETYRSARAARGESLSGMDLIYGFQTDLAMRGPAIRMAEQHARWQPNTFMYLFDWTSPVQDGELGACHALDVPFTFGTLDVPGIETFTGGGPVAARVSGQIMDAWTAFARTGRPGDAWPAYEPSERATMSIGERSGVVSAPREPERLALEDIVAAATD